MTLTSPSRKKAAAAAAAENGDGRVTNHANPQRKSVSASRSMYVKHKFFLCLFILISVSFFVKMKFQFILSCLVCLLVIN